MVAARLNHIGIAVADIDVAIRLFQEGFGLSLLREHRSTDGGPSGAIFGIGDIELEVFEHERPEERARFLGGYELGRVEHVAVEVDDIDAALAQLRRTGVETAPLRAGRLGSHAKTRPETSSGITFEVVELSGQASGLLKKP